jgi:putative peptide zinc metalloprotease protein
VRKREPSPTGVDIPSTRGLTAQFRQDLIISVGGSNKSGGKAYLVEDPVTHESFSFGEEEYFLCKAMDGTSTSEEVLNRFYRRFGVEMTELHFRNFEEHLLAMGLAETVPFSNAEKTERSAKEAPLVSPVPRERRNPRWKLFNPEKMFNFLLRIVLPFRFLIRFLLLTLVPGVVVSFYLIFRHWTEFRVFLTSFAEVLGYFGGLLFGLIAANLVRCLVQGVVCAYYQLTPSEFGIKLRRGILLRFYIEKDRVRRADRSTKLWIYGTAILVRLVFITVGALFWILFKDSNTLLPCIAVTIAQAGMIGLVLQLVPIETTDGYRWLVTFFNLPPNMIFIALEVLKLRIRGKPLPLPLAGGRGIRYLLYSLFLVTVLTIGAYNITIGLAQGLSQVFPSILGRATDYVFLAVIAGFIVQWALRTFSHKSRSSPVPESEREAVDFNKSQENATEEPTEGFSELFRRHRLLIIGVLLCLIMLIPCPYRPGGEIQILPPDQAQIQAPISGQITDVYFEGGDGKLISKGTLVGKMISYEIENQILALEQRKAQQLATIEKAKSELSKLIAGYREEEINAAQAKLDQATEEVSVATQELAAAKVNDAYSSIVLPSYEKLYKSGAIAYLQYQEEIKKAGINKIDVEKQQKNLAAVEKSRNAAKAQLDLLRSGSRQEDIDSARHSVEEAEAELSRLEQQIQYAIQQQKKGDLLMPLNGYLVTDRLAYKKGTYLKVGESFATAQNNAQPLVEVQLPEYDTEGVAVGAKAMVKLFANPGSPLHGKVLSIQPAAIPSSNQQQAVFGTRMFNVLIEIEKPPFALKAGMTGYAKISAGFQPLGLLLARPTMRFVQIEVWSWLP